MVDVRYVVVGAGAVGGTIGGRLVQSGHEVVLVARGDHARVLAADGLTLQTPEGSEVLPVQVADGIGDLVARPGDVLVLATKTQDTEPLLAQLAALPVGTGTAGSTLPVVCAQNGVTNERLALRRFATVHGMCVLLPATHLTPGVVAAHGSPSSGTLDLGRYPGGTDDLSEQVAADLSASHFKSISRPDIMRWKYAKLLNNLSNAVEVLIGPDGDDSRLRPLIQAEGLAVLAAAGIDVVLEDEWMRRRGAVSRADIPGQPRSGGSTWQSVTRGAGSIEADWLNGEIVLLGRLHGVPTPVNAVLQREANALARSGAAPTARDPAELLALAGVT